MLEGWSSTAIAGVADAFIVDENNCIGPGRVVFIGLGNEDTCKALQNSNLSLLLCIISGDIVLYLECINQWLKTK